MVLQLFIDIIAFFIAIWIVVSIFLFVFKRLLKRKKQKDLLKDIESKFRLFYGHFFFVLGMLLKLFLAALIGVSLEPTIYALNYPLGERYATLASYVVAIGIYILLPNFTSTTQQTKEAK